VDTHSDSEVDPTGFDSDATDSTMSTNPPEVALRFSTCAHPELAQKFQVAYTNSQLAETRLLKLLNEAQAPHFLFGEIMEWLHFCQEVGYNFEPSTHQRSTLIGRLRRWLNLDDISPNIMQVSLRYPHSTVVVPVTTFDFEQMFLSLVNDPMLTSNLDLLDVPRDDPFARYNGTRLSCVNSGTWYA